MMNMKILAVVTPLHIYHSCSARKTLWEEKFTGEENFTLSEFSAVNMKNSGRRNVSKHRDMKGSYKYINLDILLKFGTLDKMRFTSSYPKENLGRLVKVLINSLGLKDKARPKKYRKSRYAI